MDKEETITLKQLQNLGYQDVAFGPDGNIPPDFVIGGRIAVETRRLNQHFNNGGKVIHLEALEYSLTPRIKNLCAEYTSHNHNCSAFLSFSYRRPINDLKSIIKELRALLDEKLTSLSERSVHKMNDKLTVRFFPSQIKFKSAYSIGTIQDLNRGGFIVSEVYKNLPLAIADKEFKTRKYRHKYDEWWLALVDYIGFGLDALSFRKFLELQPVKRSFDKIILISPLKDHTHEIWPGKSGNLKV